MSAPISKVMSPVLTSTVSRETGASAITARSTVIASGTKGRLKSRVLARRQGRQKIRRQSQKALARKTPPIRKLMGNHPMPPGDIHNPRSGLETLSHNPRLQISGPPPVSPPRFHNFAPPNKPNPTVRHFQSPSVSTDGVAATSRVGNPRNQWGLGGAYIERDLC
jgi:hypothetical protein